MLIEKPRFPIREIILYGFWPGFIKKWIYRLKGYRIGRHVSLGPGSVIVGRDVEIGEYTKLGFLTVLRGTTIKIGPHVQIGSTTIFDTPHLEIGEGTRINEQVFVGGLQYPDSRLVIGRNCQIMQMSFINPARTITIGDDSGVGGHSLIFGHTSWLSRFEGYPVEFNDIEIFSRNKPKVGIDIYGNKIEFRHRLGFIKPDLSLQFGAVEEEEQVANGSH